MACPAELLALIEAYESSGSRGDREELVYYVEGATNQALPDLLAPEWGQTLSDGQVRTKTVEVSGCSVDFTIDAELALGTDCSMLPTGTLFLDQHDFDLVVTETDDNPPASGLEYFNTAQTPDATLHVENPRLVWLEDTPGADGPLIAEWGDWGGVTVGGVDYRPALRLNAYYTVALNERIQYTAAIPSGYTSVSTFTHFVPLHGFRLIPRTPASTPSTSDPMRLGTYSSGDISGTDYNIETDTTPTLDPLSRMLHIPSTRQFSGEATSISDFADDVAAYMASKTPYQPDVTFNAEAREVTVSYMTRENALYWQQVDCAEDQYYGLTLDYGGYLHPMGGGFPQADTEDPYLLGVMRRVIVESDPTCGTASTNFARFAPDEEGDYVPYLSVAVATAPPDGTPPTVTPNPPLIKPKPVSGGCKASIDGPSSCNFNVPVEPDPDSPDFPMPGDFVQPEMPDIPMPEMPVLDVELPVMPPIDCLLPDFGNLAGCPPGPGSGNLPGGRDRKGRRGNNVGGIKTGGPTYGIRDPTFRDTFPDGTIDPDTGEPIIPPTRSFPAGSSVMTAITIILLDLGISPLNIVFEVGPEWDKTFGPKTFDTTVRMFDAAQWLASLIMCKIIDEGDGNVYIGPPTHRPGQNTWTFNSQFPNVGGEPPMFGLGYGASMGEAYYAVKVWGAHLSTPVFALVDTPFSTDPSNILQIEVGPDYTLAEAQDLAAFRAGLIRRDAVMIQVEVPYSQEMFMRDKLVLKFPDRGLQWEYIIFAKQSEISQEKIVNILTGVLPATLEELENFPEVLDEGINAVDAGFA